MYTTKLLLTCLEKISSRLIPRIVLTTDEVKFVLGLREDFSGSDINNLVKIKIEIISVT